MSGYERTEVENHVRYIVASDILQKVFSSLVSKEKRRRGKRVSLVVELLRQKAEVGDRVIAYTEERPEDRKARTLRGAIDEFKLIHPRLGKELEELIQQTRREQNEYLVFALEPDYKLGEEDYIGVLRDLGFNTRRAMALYPHILEISEKLKKASEQKERSILIPR